VLKAAATPGGWMGNLRAGSLLLDKGFVYNTGAAKWQRLNLKTGKTEDLVTNMRLLPDYGSGDIWHLTMSNNFGRVAWHGGKLYALGAAEAETSPEK